MKVVIIGGVAGGASAAARLRRLDENAEIIILERGDYISYANCGLPYYIGDVITDQKDLTLQTPASFRARFNVEVRVGHLAQAIEPQTKTISVKNLRDGSQYTQTYDKLILSPGAKPQPLPADPAAEPYIFSLRTIPDTLKIKEALQRCQPKQCIIIGGGYIGIEMAENLCRQGVEVTVVQRGNHVIAPLDGDMASQVHSYLRQKGIRLLLNSPVRQIQAKADGSGVKVILKQGEISGNLIISSIGVVPESDLAQEAGLHCNKKGCIMVNPHMQTSQPDIYALGDAVEITDLVTGLKGFIPLAGPANKQGRIAADHICGLNSAYKGTQGSSVLKFFDLAIATTGINEKAAQAAGLNYDKIYTYSASHATYYPGAANISIKALFDKESGRILGAQLIGMAGVDKRCDVLATAIRSGLTAGDLAELELCYAPPFSSAKDPVNMIGFIIENLLTGKVQQFHWHEVADLIQDGHSVLLDIRTRSEYLRGHITGSRNIPLDELRQRLSELDQSKPICLICQTALRSYIGCRILSQKGFNCSHLAGGYRLYASIMEDQAFDHALTQPCGLK